MLKYDSKTYDAMLGNITEKTIQAAASCMSQCTGCMCSCRCSCSGGKKTDFEWEVI
ncbi:MAG: FibroRumin family radical SAM-modified Cys-rich RiPP [Ruminococcaceae bacterium]|nr:FibroRumin family radical SAM-modified Cys-rich RiPP [Oscillospiraceae bacterium]